MPRVRCACCERPQSVCVCREISSQSNILPVVVIQHPDEKHHPLNTARLACRGLERAVLLTGLHWTPDTLAEHLPAGWLSHAALLYPGMSDGHLESRQGSLSALIVLDGTWRNTRELLLCNSWLGGLPRIALRHERESAYRIRKAQRADALSTIEAVGLAMQARQQSFDLGRYLHPFDAMIDIQIRHMGEDTYRRNYADPLENGST